MVDLANRGCDGGVGLIGDSRLVHIAFVFNELDVRARAGVSMDAVALGLGSIDRRISVSLFVLLVVAVHDRVQRFAGSGDRRFVFSVKSGDRLRAGADRGQ